MSVFNISQISLLTGIAPQTIRVWESRYGIVKPERQSSGIRFYSDDELKILLQAALLSGSGLKISDICELSNDERRKKIQDSVLNDSDFNMDEQAILDAVFELDENLLNNILSKRLIRSGFEETIENFVFPFMRTLGFLWLSERISSAYEHFLTNQIRRLITVVIDSLEVKLIEPKVKFLLFLPEGELHELGLLYANYLIRSTGFGTYYLGQNVNIKHVEKLIKISNAEHVIVSSITQKLSAELFSSIRRSIRKGNNTKWILAGNYSIGSISLKHPNIKYLYSMQDLKIYLENVNS